MKRRRIPEELLIFPISSHYQVQLCCDVFQVLPDSMSECATMQCKRLEQELLHTRELSQTNSTCHSNMANNHEQVRKVKTVSMHTFDNFCTVFLKMDHVTQINPHTLTALNH